MKQTLTAKLKLEVTEEQFAALRKTQLAYRDALNFASEYAFASKIFDRIQLQKECYREIRKRFGLPSQMACNVTRQVGAIYKGLWKKVRRNSKHRRRGSTRRRYRGLDVPPKFSSPTLTYSYGRDFSFRGEGFLSVRTLSGRIIVPYHGYERHVKLIRKGISGGVKVGAAKLWFDGERKRLYLLVPLEAEVREPDLADIHNIVGVDLGVRTLAVSTTLDNRVRFYQNGRKKKWKDHYARLRKELQRKGTRKAKNEGKRPRSIRRRLSVIGRRERRLMLDVNHVVAKSMVATNPRSLIGIEKLTGIREHTMRNAGGKASTKQRRANRQKGQWSFAELAALLEYKARLAGGMVVAVEADYTSQACVKCGHTSKANRPDGGLLFRCTACECELHADLVGARNVALRALLFRQDWERTGCLSVTPGVHEDPLEASNAEAKAERLKRYSELRWSSGASPVALDGATDSACQGHPRVVHLPGGESRRRARACSSAG